jgi:predicted nucleotide-binding protein
MSLLKNEIGKYEKKGFEVSQRRKLKYGSRAFLNKKRKGILAGSDHVYLYFAEGNCTVDSLHECFRDYVKIYEQEGFSEEDRGFFICSGTFEEKLFRRIRKLSIENENVRNSIRAISHHKSSKEKMELKPTSTKNMFIVHGKDDKSKLELARMLEKLGFNPIILSEQPDKGRTLIEKLEQETLDVGYAFVILTPDDVGMEKEAYEKIVADPSDQQSSGLCYRARQNVILELGYFVGKIGRNKVCCLHKGNVELPSDIHGVIYKKFIESVDECYKPIIDELRAAGYEIRV